MHFNYLLDCSIRSSCQHKLKDSKLKPLSSLSKCSLFPFCTPHLVGNQIKWMSFSIPSTAILLKYYLSTCSPTYVLPSLFYHIWILFSKNVSVSSLLCNRETFKFLSLSYKTLHRLTLTYHSKLRKTERMALSIVHSAGPMPSIQRALLLPYLEPTYSSNPFPKLSSV